MRGAGLGGRAGTPREAPGVPPRHPPSKRALCSLAALCVVLAACSESSKLVLDDGRVIRAEIVGGDREFLELKGELRRVHRDRVVDIQYAGSVAQTAGATMAIVGVLALALGGTFLAVSDQLGEGAVPGALVLPLMGGAQLSAIGIPLLVSGWRRQRAAREASHPPDGPLLVGPSVGPGGVGIGVRF